MKLFREGPPGREKPALAMADGTMISLENFTADFDEAFFSENRLPALQDWLNAHRQECRVIKPGFRFGSCVARPSKIICVGLNYAQHAAEGGMAVPTEPVLFFKSTTALSGPYDDLIIPRGSEKTDWEVELAVVIGRKASYVTEAEALDYVAGYCVHNDYSERAFQLERGGQWVKGKSCDSFAPMGPYLVTSDEVPDPHRLRLWLDVNGEHMQDSNTEDFIFNIPTIISYISGFMTLLPGDIISTGTPAGVGLGKKPPKYLVPGDIITLGIDGLGEQRQEACAWPGRNHTPIHGNA